MIRIAAKNPPDGLHDSCGCVADADGSNTHTLIDEPIKQGFAFRQTIKDQHTTSVTWEIDSVITGDQPQELRIFGCLEVLDTLMSAVLLEDDGRWLPLFSLGCRGRDYTSLASINQFDSKLSLCSIRITRGEDEEALGIARFATGSDDRRFQEAESAGQ